MTESGLTSPPATSPSAPPPPPRFHAARLPDADGLDLPVDLDSWHPGQSTDLAPAMAEQLLAPDAAAPCDSKTTGMYRRHGPG